MNEEMLASIVVATLNSARTLPKCLSSIAGQSYQWREIIVVDGGSTDGTQDIFRAAASQVSHSISEPDYGIYDAWNKGIRACRGEWICFMGADDEFSDPDALRALMRAAEQANAARIVYGRINLVTVKGTVAQTVGKPWPDARKDLFDGFMLPQTAALHHRSLFQDLGSFDRSYRVAGDYEFLLRELIGRNALFVDRVVANVRLGGVSSRAQSIHLALREVTRARRAHGLGGPGLRLRLALVSSWVGARLHYLVGERVFNYLADCYRVIRGKPRVWSV
jgi:glycosyltransferase involved in cell wall biosynthesis